MEVQKSREGEQEKQYERQQGSLQQKNELKSRCGLIERIGETKRD